MAAPLRGSSTLMPLSSDCCTINPNHHSNLGPWPTPASNNMLSTNQTTSRLIATEAVHPLPEYNYPFQHESDWDVWPYGFVSGTSQYSPTDACLILGGDDAPETMDYRSLDFDGVCDDRYDKDTGTDINQHTRNASFLPSLIDGSSSIFGDTDSSLVSYGFGDMGISGSQSLYDSPSATTYETQQTVSMHHTPVLARSGLAVPATTQPHQATDLEGLSSDGLKIRDQDQYHKPESPYPPLPPFDTINDFDTGLSQSFSTYNNVQHVGGHVDVSAACRCANQSTHDNARCDTSLRGGYTTLDQHAYPALQARRARLTRPGNTFRDPARDSLLLRYKAQGMSYKDIKSLGCFDEAESTLRGRYRTLTKPKEARVRRPGWSDRDVALLKQVVAQHLRTKLNSPTISSGRSSQSRKGDQYHALSKIPWKQVAEQMASRGCYRFGNATVKKKYISVMGLDDGDGEQ